MVVVAAQAMMVVRVEAGVIARARRMAVMMRPTANCVRGGEARNESYERGGDHRSHDFLEHLFSSLVDCQ